MVSTIEKTLGKKAIIEVIPLPAGDVKRTFANITKAKLKFGYSPKYDFENGISRFIEWLLMNK